MQKIKVKQEQFKIYQYSKNVENEGKTGRFQISPLFNKMWKMKVKPEDFRFYRYSKKVENGGQPG